MIINVYVSNLKTTEEKQKVLKLLRDSSWKYLDYDAEEFLDENQMPVVRRYTFEWCGIGEYTIPDNLPKECYIEFTVL